MNDSTQKQRVAIIGAGPSGIVALKNLTTSSNQFEPVAFEKNFWPSGVWVYSDQTGKNDFGLPLHSAMYDNLKSNIPKELMEIPGFEFPKEWNKSFISRQQVLEYLNSYIDRYSLRQFIKTHTIVKDVSPVELKGKEGVKWKVTYSDIRNVESEKTDIFDSVLVCNGQDFDQNVPVIPGMDNFKGRIIHSRDYRRPEHFDGLTVAVFGCHFSGEEICLQIKPFVKKLYACHLCTDIPPSFPEIIEQKPTFVEMTEKSVVFPDGSQIDVDTVIFCTGYNLAFPFLKENIIQVKDSRVTPIYKHMVHIEYPNLIFLGIPRQWCYFPQYHEMAKLAVLMLEGKVVLPTKTQMRYDSEEEFKARMKEGVKTKYTHLFGDGDRQWRLNKEYAEMGGFDPLPPVLGKIWNDAYDERKMNLEHCNEFDYIVTGPNSYRCLTA